MNRPALAAAAAALALTTLTGCGVALPPQAQPVPTATVTVTPTSTPSSAASTTSAHPSMASPSSAGAAPRAANVEQESLTLTPGEKLEDPARLLMSIRDATQAERTFKVSMTEYGPSGGTSASAEVDVTDPDSPRIDLHVFPKGHPANRILRIGQDVWQQHPTEDSRWIHTTWDQLPKEARQVLSLLTSPSEAVPTQGVEGTFVGSDETRTPPEWVFRFTQPGAGPGAQDYDQVDIDQQGRLLGLAMYRGGQIRRIFAVSDYGSTAPIEAPAASKVQEGTLRLAE